MCLREMRPADVPAVRGDEQLGWAPTGERTRSTFAPYPELVRYELDVDGV